MNNRDNQPLEIVSRIRDIALLFFALTTLILTYTCLEERNSPSVDNETTCLADSTYLTVDTVNTEMSMAIERAIVLERVKDIYQLVRNEYAYHGTCWEYEWFDRAFCSRSWNELLMAVRSKEEQTGTLFFEIDRWSLLRDPGNFVSFEEFEVKDLRINDNQKRASVAFVVYDDDTYTPARVDLVYEDNRWVIDDFHNLRYSLHLRGCMWDYLTHDVV